MKKLMMMAVAAALALSGTTSGMLDMILVYDTYADQGDADSSFGNLTVLRLQGKGELIDTSGPVPVLIEYPIQRIFLQFDISAIPAGATLTNAEFGIYLAEAYEFDSPKIQLWFLNNDAWDDTLTWNESSGLLGNEVAFEIVQSTGATGEYWKWTWSDFSYWDYADALTAGKVSFMLTMDPEDNDMFNYAVFHSHENDVFKPYLKLAYVPEPATLGLLAMGMGGIAASRKRR